MIADAVTRLCHPSTSREVTTSEVLGAAAQMTTQWRRDRLVWQVSAAHIMSL